MRPRKVRMAEKGRQREGKGTKGALRRGGGVLAGPANSRGLD